MKCKVCGAESGKYPLCRDCNDKKEKGGIIKCQKCGNWHYASQQCSVNALNTNDDKYLYEVRKTLISKSEQEFYSAIKSSVPEGFCVFPQINLAAFIDRTDDVRYRNELFRNVDFLITDANYQPKIIIEINDRTHLNADRRERDEKVKKICEEAGMPIIRLWTSYGVNTEYIKSQITDTLGNLPVARVHHFNKKSMPEQQLTATLQTQKYPTEKKRGCYIATCVYGSYDCPQVWTLRRYRDMILARTWYGRAFISVYYAVSPTLVKIFGNMTWFRMICKKKLDKIVDSLQNTGIDASMYVD